MEPASTQRGRGRGAPSRSSHSPLWIPPVANAPSVFLDSGGAHFHMGMPTLAYGMGGPPGGGASSYERPAWYELRALNVSTSSPAAVTSLLLDPLEELIWAGLDNGRLVSYLGGSMERYSAVQAHRSPIRQLLADHMGVLSLSCDTIRHHSRGGVLDLSFTSDSWRELRCGIHLSPMKNDLLVGGDTPSLYLYDMTRSRIIKEVNINTGLSCIKRSRLICCGGQNGQVLMLDPRTFKVENMLECHPCGIMDLDLKGDLLVTCGSSKRTGQGYPVLDPVVKVYDVRTMRPLSPIAFPPGALFLKFHPKFSSSLFIVSQNGQLQLCEAQGDLTNVQMYHIDCGGDLCTSFDISSTGEVLVFGDSGGYVHQWVDREDFQINQYSIPTQVPEKPLRPAIPKVYDDHSPLSLNIIPPIDEPLLSDWPAAMDFSVSKPPQQIDPAVTANLKQVGRVLFGPNTSGLKRNQVVQIPHLSQANALKGRRTFVPPNKLAVLPPKAYRKVEVKYSRLAVQEFNFAYYNQTKFGGLENLQSNAYTNSCLQTLYYIPQLRAHTLNHLCEEEFCLSCELGFLFHMLDISNGVNCNSSNFLRCFRHIPQAASLFEPAEPDPEKLGYGKLMQQFASFLLNQLHKASLRKANNLRIPAIQSSQGNTRPGAKQAPQMQVQLVDQVFGVTSLTRSRCPACGSLFSREQRSFIVELALPPQSREEPTEVSFAAMLQHSLSREYRANGWCERCARHLPLLNKTQVKTFPNVLCLSFPLKEEDIGYWRERHSIENATVPTNDWIPSRIGLQRDLQNDCIVVQEHRNGLEATGQEDVYELTSVIWYIYNPMEKNPTKRGHLVCHNKIPPAYRKHAANSMPINPESTEEDLNSEWYLFNDFHVVPVSLEEVVHFNSHWKIPCILYYTHINSEDRLPVPKIINPITEDVFFIEDPLTNRSINKGPQSFMPLSREELPKAGDIVALDAEFVSLQPEETIMKSSGKRAIVKAGHFSLARVSVVLGKRRKGGDGEIENVEELEEPFIDDYIAMHEPIAAYLTRFSGIVPGDLDPAVSPHHVITLKSAYLKLRYLVDVGCIFVGHGLQKDFKIINILVPPEQVRDTVDLYNLERQRKLSLRFLTSHLLNRSIQSQTHCSAEDAKAALALYWMYKRLVKAGKLEDTIQALYRIGRLSNWHPKQSTTEEEEVIPLDAETTLEQQPMLQDATEIDDLQQQMFFATQPYLQLDDEKEPEPDSYDDSIEYSQLESNVEDVLAYNHEKPLHLSNNAHSLDSPPMYEEVEEIMQQHTNTTGYHYSGDTGYGHTAQSPSHFAYESQYHPPSAHASYQPQFQSPSYHSAQHSHPYSQATASQVHQYPSSQYSSQQQQQQYQGQPQSYHPINQFQPQLQYAQQFQHHQAQYQHQPQYQPAQQQFQYVSQPQQYQPQQQYQSAQAQYQAHLQAQYQQQQAQQHFSSPTASPTPSPPHSHHGQFQGQGQLQFQPAYH